MALKSPPVDENLTRGGIRTDGKSARNHDRVLAEPGRAGVRRAEVAPREDDDDGGPGPAAERRLSVAELIDEALDLLREAKAAIELEEPPF